MTTPDLESVTKDFLLLLDVEDYEVYSTYLQSLVSTLRQDEMFKTFLASEKFGKDLQRRIAGASDLKNTLVCIDYIRLMNQEAVDLILNYRGFAQNVLPAKINNDYDLDRIGLCFEVVGYHDRLFADITVGNGDIDVELLVEKFNFEEDLYTVGHALERINRADTTLTKILVEHRLFNHDRIKELIRNEKDDNKIGEYLYAVKYAAPEVAKTVYNVE